MKIALFGASGTIGQRILNEALERGHEVTAIVRNPERVPPRERVHVRSATATDAEQVANAIAGHDAVISAIAPDRKEAATLITAIHGLLAGLRRAGVKRFVMVGGAGSLEVAPGVQVMDGPNFPAFLLPIAKAHGEVLAICRGVEDLDWTNISPSATIAPGERTNTFRIGSDELLKDAAGKSAISSEDYAIAVLNEVEHPQAIRRRITVGY
jgi:putative NADH-flavin reductase